MFTNPIVEQGLKIDQASKALILLHGRGGTALDILKLAQEFHTQGFYIAAPQAPQQSWYPYSFMADEQLNEPWLSSSIKTIKQLIEKTSIVIPKERIYLMGFSQGACLALETACRFAEKYGGVIAFTGGLIGKKLNKKNYHGHFEGTKVFIGTSDCDPHVPLERSRETKILMENLGADVTLKVYPGMTHTINQDEINFANHLITN